MRTLNAANLVPPYVSYSNWLRLLEAVGKTLPSAVDESYLSSLNVSESGIKALRSALRFLGLVNENGRPTERLQQLANALNRDGAAKSEALKEIILQAYKPLFSSDFDLRSATTAQLKLYFGTMGAHGQIQQKCSSFFLNLARDAGLELSPQLTRRAGVTDQHPVVLAHKRSTATMRGRQSAPSPSAELDLLIALFPKFDIDWPEERKQRWFKDFAKLLEISEAKVESRAS